MPLTYNALIEQVQETTEDDSQEFVAALPNILERAQLRLNRDLDMMGQTVYTTASCSAGNPFLLKPTGTLVVKNVVVFVSASTRNLLQRTSEFIQEYWPNRSSEGIPKYYANHDFDTIYFAPTPVSNFQCDFVTVIAPATISAANQTNYYTTFCGHALFNASMLEACVFQKNVEQAKMWQLLYQESVNALRTETERNARDNMQANTMPVGENGGRNA